MTYYIIIFANANYTIGNRKSLGLHKSLKNKMTCRLGYTINKLFNFSNE